MSNGFWSSRGDSESSLSSQIDALQNELREIKRVASKRGRKSYAQARDNASEFVDEVRDLVQDAGVRISRRARDAGDTVKDNPGTAAVVGLVAVGLIALLLASRRR